MDSSKRGRFVVDTLKHVSESTQKEMISFLKSRNIEHHAFYITNAISIKKANLPLLETLDKSFHSQIEMFELSTQDHIYESTNTTKTSNLNFERPPSVEDGVEWVKAPQVWKSGVKGKGIVVGVIDTGVFLHDDLKDTYRGKDGNHNFNWFDAYGGKSEPYDDHYHGTHCHGTVGGHSDKLIVGVAPESEWISCKYLSGAGGGSVVDCIKCMEFMLAPHDLEGKNHNSDLRPHIVSNSYGGSHNIARERSLDSLLSAGVEMVYAAGNSGRCNTIGFPARYDDALAVGALQKRSDRIAGFSSKGPGINRRLKPELSAPGTSVRSTSHKGEYRSASGTSMACPHVAGAIALLWSAHPELQRKIKKTRELFYETSKKQESSDCASPRDTPNNVFGYGTIDCWKVIKEADQSKIIDDFSTLMK